GGRRLRARRARALERVPRARHRRARLRDRAAGGRARDDRDGGGRGALLRAAARARARARLAAARARPRDPADGPRRGAAGPRGGRRRASLLRGERRGGGRDRARAPALRGNGRGGRGRCLTGAGRGGARLASQLRDERAEPRERFADPLRHRAEAGERLARRRARLLVGGGRGLDRADQIGDRLGVRADVAARAALLLDRDAHLAAHLDREQRVAHQAPGRAGLLVHRPRDALHVLRGAARRLGHVLRVARLLVGSPRDLGDAAAGVARGAADRLERLAGAPRAGNALLDGVDALRHRGGRGARLLLDRGDAALDLLRALGGAARERLHLVGDDGEGLAVLARL